MVLLHHRPLPPPSDLPTSTKIIDTPRSQFTCSGLVKELLLKPVQPVEWSLHSARTDMNGNSIRFYYLSFDSHIPIPIHPLAAFVFLALGQTF
jgi:hypothetical protein